ncbi:hypothetical protein [Actinokineospora sp. NPDC004072]
MDSGKPWSSHSAATQRAAIAVYSTVNAGSDNEQVQVGGAMPIGVYPAAAGPSARALGALISKSQVLFHRLAMAPATSTIAPPPSAVTAHGTRSRKMIAKAIKAVQTAAMRR